VRLIELSAGNLCTEVNKRQLEGTHTHTHTHTHTRTHTQFFLRWGIDYTGT
jgi:hypothetical protein